MIIIEQQPGNILRIAGDVDSLFRFHDVFQTIIWPKWREHIDTCKQLQLEQTYINDSISSGYLYLFDNNDTRSGIKAAIVDAQSIMTVIQ